ncbi:sigma factor binding protein 1 [Forsythia ovata]|uniref:Sigma factor binding protein 1 n=1 Tax=Forsythia ovata TaxID=205694 RepID=A0ABD1TPM7_9LAMI
MDIIQSVPREMSSHKRKTKSKRSNKNSLKVVYISSPMKVKTSATRFRSLVQELTGRHSDVSRFMDSNDSNDFHEFDDNSDGSLLPKSVNDDHLSSISTQRESPTSSDSTFFEPMGNVFPCTSCNGSRKVFDEDKEQLKRCPK